MSRRTDIAEVIYRRMKQQSHKCKHNDSIHDQEILEKMADRASDDVLKWLDNDNPYYRLT